LKLASHLKPFHNSNWPYYEKFQILLPTVVNGVTAYCVGQAAPILVDGQPPLPGDNTHEDDHPMHCIRTSGEEGNSDRSLILSPSPSPSPSKQKSSTIGNKVSYMQPGAALLISLPASTSLSLPASNSSLSLPLSSGRKSLKIGKLSVSKNVMTALDAGFDQMGRTLQQFTDVIKKSLLPQETPAVTQHDKAVELV
jgi:hypothetical protein